MFSSQKMFLWLSLSFKMKKWFMILMSNQNGKEDIIKTMSILKWSEFHCQIARWKLYHIQITFYVSQLMSSFQGYLSIFSKAHNRLFKWLNASSMLNSSFKEKIKLKSVQIRTSLVIWLLPIWRIKIILLKWQSLIWVG